MTLLEIRTQFAKLSGRYDLVGTAFVDAGADFYLRAGLKFLDRRAEFDKDVGKFFYTPVAGEYFIPIPSGRTLEKVWWADAVNGRKELVRQTPTELQTTYGTQPYANIGRGTPIKYAIAILRGIPDNTALDAMSGYASEIAVDGSQLLKTGILIMPPPDAGGQIEVWGKYETPFPTTEGGTNFWFSHFEHVGVWAALYILESSYRNTQGAADWLAAIDSAILGIDRDLVETDTADADQMEG